MSKWEVESLGVEGETRARMKVPVSN